VVDRIAVAGLDLEVGIVEEEELRMIVVHLHLVLHLEQLLI